MEVIYQLLAGLAGIAFLAMIVGLIRPELVLRWGEKRTRERVLLYYGIGAMVISMMASIAMPDEVREDQEQARLERERQEEQARLEQRQGRLEREREKEQARLERAKEILERGTRLLSIARTAYESQDYQTAIDSADEATSALKKAKSSINEVAVLTNQVQAFLDSAKAAIKKEREQKRLKRRLERERRYAAEKKERERKRLEQKRKEAALKKEREEARYTTNPGTFERIVEKHALHVFGYTVSRDGGEVPKVISISAGNTVNVAYRESDPLFGDMRKSILMKANQFMQRVFTDPACSKVQVVLLRPHFVLVNQYGQTSESQIGKLLLNREVAEKIKWDPAVFTWKKLERLLKTEGQLWWHNAFKK